MAEIGDLDTTDANNTGRWPENMAFSAVNDAGRADEGLLARWFKDWNASITATGSSNAFAITSNRTISSLANNTVMAFTANHTITGAATLNLNGLGAKSIKRFNGNALASGDIVSGQPVTVIYKSSPDVWYMMSAAAALTGNSFADFDENAAPGDPAADDARLYAKDDGSGTTVMAYRDSAGTESVVGGIATQAQMEAASSTIKSVAPGRQHYHPLHPKGSVLFNGSGSVSVVVSAGNVSGVSYLGTGTYRVSFSPSFSNTNYGVIGWARGTGPTQVDFCVSAADTGNDSKAVNQMDIRVSNASGSAPADSSEIFLIFFGDL